MSSLIVLFAVAVTAVFLAFPSRREFYSADELSSILPGVRVSVTEAPKDGRNDHAICMECAHPEYACICGWLL